ncbi:AbrB/MazE/SpoVT family DNA-binding domain-containing protein [Undibacterium danionis]|jgi:hypothetical protein|uniref:AbrB/MazE/SpoVT family DNA-binding domain-containing protein n=1 Tax=Undibacterium danionis TaxID=1812100 RepID=A0ABV6IJ74_9BURK
MSLTDNSLSKWEVTLIDAGDGSGDCYVEFPKELLEKLDWHEGDVINVDIVDEQLLLTKVNG